MKHLKASLDISGSLTTKSGQQFDEHMKSTRTLQDVGIVDHPNVVMKSFKTYHRLQHTHPVTIYTKNNEKFTVKVRSVTDITELKHIVQDKLGIPMDEQLYSQNSRLLKKEIRVVSLCQHGRGKLMLARCSKSEPAGVSMHHHGMCHCCYFTTIIGIYQHTQKCHWKACSNQCKTVHFHFSIYIIARNVTLYDNSMLP